jgi:uncharacterized repeat protein (TIGR03803 family)
MAVAFAISRGVGPVCYRPRTPVKLYKVTTINALLVNRLRIIDPRVAGVIILHALLLSACNNGVTTPSLYSIGGSLSGLTSGASVVLQNNGGNNTTASANGSFVFTTLLANNDSYAVTVLTQPTGQTCAVSAGNGRVTEANITTVRVACTTNTYTVSGSVSGLNSGARVTLQNNGRDTTPVTANGAFRFAAPVPYKGSYAVTVLTHPTGQTCMVSAGNGTVTEANITNVHVACTNTYTVSGSVSGLNSGAQVTLANNGIDRTTVTANGSFSFATAVPNHGPYAVTVLTQPTGQTCVVSAGNGTVTEANITSVHVACTTNTYTVSGSVSGLKSGAQVTLANNGIDRTTVTANGSFSFATRVPYNGSYAVTILAQPPAQLCTATGGSGSQVAANVSVSIACGPASETLLYSFKGGTDGRGPYGGVIQANDGNFYGTTNLGGTANAGTVFKITPAGVESVLYSFQGAGDGGYSRAGLVQASDGNFYGTTEGGGTANAGTVFKITPAGVESVLYSFQGGSDGADPCAGLIQASDGNFYGTTVIGGTANLGTVFKITPDGVETVLHSFQGSPDGKYLYGVLIQGNDGNLYGTTEQGGTANAGTVFKITSAGVESVLYSFQGGNDGGDPQGGLVLDSDGNFYGTTGSDGVAYFGTVFKVTPAGVETVLHEFGGSDGGNSYASLIRADDGNFYGTSNYSSTETSTLFEITPAGVMTVLYVFGSGTDGEAPLYAGLFLGNDGNFYGTTVIGGTGGVSDGGYGTVFKF